MTNSELLNRLSSTLVDISKSIKIIDENNISIRDVVVSKNDDTSLWEVFDFKHSPGGSPNWDDPPDDDLNFIAESAYLVGAVSLAIEYLIRSQLNQFSLQESEEFES